MWISVSALPTSRANPTSTSTMQSRIKKEIEDFVDKVADTDEWLRENRPHVQWLLDADCAETPADGAFVKAMAEGAGRVQSPVIINGLGAHSDMGWYVHQGIPTINFGPGSPLIALSLIHILFWEYHL